MNFSTLLNLHELTPFFSPSLLRKELEILAIYLTFVFIVLNY